MDTERIENTKPRQNLAFPIEKRIEKVHYIISKLYIRLKNTNKYSEFYL